MPIYEYTCTGCGLAFELRRPIASFNDRAQCPDCGDSGERRLSLPSLVAVADGQTQQGRGGGGGCCGGGCCTAG
ncbi:MAG: zinc ribbon domain-containing protein [Dehalococcoidia bacterium]|nr:zinc ribbon domain-containing protein [Dehalococcoidia bacterium]